MGFWEIMLYIVSYFGLYTAIFFLLTIIENRKHLGNPIVPKKLPKVSVIVPACNEEACIAKTLKSLLELDYPKKLLEIIVVNDGSVDKTLQIAQSFKKYGVKVYSKKNGGKASAINIGIKKSSGEIVGCLDADSIVMPDALKKMIGYFKNKNVMSVTPSLKCTTPITIWQRIQVIEFMLGVYLRKVFAFMGSIHVTPGPFTIFRKKFFDMHGGYDETSITEDQEISFRIQHYGYEIENAIDANVYATAMPTFQTMKKQRIRWYKGFIQNSEKYKHIIFSKKFGNLGLFALPSAYLSVLLAIVMSCYAIYILLERNIQRAINLYNVNFDIWKLIKFDFDPFYLNSSPLAMIGIISLAIGVTMIVLAKKLSNEKMSMTYSYILFLLFYLPLYAYWWVVSIKARVLNEDVGWHGRKRGSIELKYS